jgi:hypothetical protein
VQRACYDISEITGRLAYSGIGFAGQKLRVIPAYDLVVCPRHNVRTRSVS